ncbi:zinc finger dihydrouridine synthase [Phanerochaete sordida]|uniref:tRNA-dihydrouridine(47) synthase [NAD(P)(+)] n=1 Tax=Phanerochaete sordida TaxID=48140 RepID=A0A9P3GNF6_9APHY|nr:zinc finger dihydrouridine synthase [Phanerochaete sordida]
MSTSSTLPAGTAPIKPEFILANAPRAVPDDDAAEGSTSHVNGRSADQNPQEDGQTDSRGGRKKWSKEERKNKRGANKGRRFQKVRDDLELCWRVAVGKTCEFGAECRNSHDVKAYLASKPRDLRFPPLSALSNEPPFVKQADEDATMGDAENPSVDFSTTCPVFERTGECKHGLRCRYLGGHVKRKEDGELELVVDEEKKAQKVVAETELNFVQGDTLKQIRSKKFPHPIANAYLKELQEAQKADNAPKAAAPVVAAAEASAEVSEPAPEAPPADPAPQPAPIPAIASEDVSQVDTPDVPLRPAEKKRLLWKGKTYLAPLTTVGNLPFRRLCVDYGADITCGEMGLANSFLGASKEEYSLIRRHPSEPTFGIQMAGSKPQLLVPAAEILGQACEGNLDFVDLNCGCPIDLVYKTGSGSALLDAAGKLGKIVVGMNKALGGTPVTVKLRTGVKDGKNNAHKIMPRLATEWGAAALTLHGRTRQQRYSKLADWDYIKTCVEAVRAREEEDGLEPVPIFGGGDAFSSQDYWEKVNHSGVDGVMVARGALIKPWIFTEIKEHREWDISSRERLELVRKYAEYGLNHFGSDTAGVNTTRRYLCEALSFQYRYVPIGLLETLPGRLNDRPPAFRGRDDLETLLASGDSRDWVKISEMFLGPAPETWNFTPKHKSNAYGTEESQG